MEPMPSPSPSPAPSKGRAVLRSYKPPKKQSRYFVDQIVEDIATLTDGTNTWTVPVSVLPATAKEGTWVGGEPESMKDMEAKRAAMGASDTGGPINLSDESEPMPPKKPVKGAKTRTKTPLSDMYRGKGK